MRKAFDAAGWVRSARRVGAAPNADPEFLPIDPDTGGILVTGAGAAPAATKLKIADGDDTLGEANVVAGRVHVSDQHTQGLTDAQLRAAAVPVSGPLTDAQLRAARVPVDTALTQPLTDAQLRATPVPVDTGLTQTSPLTDAQLRATAVPVSGPLTDAQLRATPIDVLTRVNSRTLLTLTDATYTLSGATAALNTGDLVRVAVDLTVVRVAGVGAELRFAFDRQGADNRWYPVWTSAAITAPGTVSTTIGHGMAVAHDPAASSRLRWEITGSSPEFDFGGGLVGK